MFFIVLVVEYNVGYMTVVLSVVGVLLFILLVFVDSARPSRTTMSLFELRRRRSEKDSRASETLRREELLAQAEMLKLPLRALLIIGLALVLVHLLGWRDGVVSSLIIGLLYGRIASFKLVRRLSNKLYAGREASLLALVARHESKLRLLAGKGSLGRSSSPLSSKEELEHLLAVSSIFSDEDKKLLESAMHFNDKNVSDIMIKMKNIVTVKPSELLGPLVLDDLHKTKHEIFPVKKGDEIIGMLDIRDHIALKHKELVRVDDVMHAAVVRVDQSEPLDEALRVLVAAKQPYLIVVDDEGQAVGMLGLGDVVRALTGWTRR